MIESRQQVLDYLYEGYFDGTNLPTYYKAQGFSDFNFEKFSDKSNIPKYTQPIKFYAPKGNTKLREFTLVNPYSYWHLANTLSGDGFDLIANKLNGDNKVKSYGLLASNGESFRSWRRAMEIDLPSDASSYSFLAITDISNCYKSIYTHSLSWALHGKSFIKADNNRRDLSLVGNRIDCAFQRSMDEQTNGLPIGNAASHFAAELILKDVDERLSSKLNDLDFKAYRFRDDYRFLTRTKDAAKKIVRELDQILQLYYGMHLNEEKTEFFDDIIGNCYRPWKSLVRGNSLLPEISLLSSSTELGLLLKRHSLDTLLLSIYEAQKLTAYRLAPALLENIATYLTPKHVKHQQGIFYAIESILEAIVDIREESMPQFAKIITTIARAIEKPSDRQGFMKHVVRDERLSKLSEQQLCWIYRMLLSDSYENLLNHEHPLIKVLNPKEYTCDYAMFEHNDMDIFNEIKDKFTIVNRSLLSSMRNKEIAPIERNIFYGIQV